jgi:hypothetical protein
MTENLEKKYVIEETQKHTDFNKWLRKCPVEWGKENEV